MPILLDQWYGYDTKIRSLKNESAPIATFSIPDLLLDIFFSRRWPRSRWNLCYSFSGLLVRMLCVFVVVPILKGPLSTGSVVILSQTLFLHHIIYLPVPQLFFFSQQGKVLSQPKEWGDITTEIYQRGPMRMPIFRDLIHRLGEDSVFRYFSTLPWNRKLPA